jgi:hypothetical protein
LSRKSENQPPNNVPAQAAMNGRMAIKPTFSHAMCRSTARKVGNHVRKKTLVELQANCPMQMPSMLR